MTMHAKTPADPMIAEYERGKKRALSWLRVADALIEQRDALEIRIRLQDPADVHLVADVAAFCKLASALAAFLDETRREAA